MTPFDTATVRSTLPRGAMRIWRRDSIVFWHRIQWVLIPSLVDPVVYLFAMGFGLGEYLDGFEGESYRDFIGPGLMASGAMFQASFETTWVAFWKLDTNKTYYAMVSTPLQPEDVVLGESLWAATRGLVSSSCFLLVLILIGALHSPWAIFMPVAAFLVAWCFGALGLLCTSYVKNADVYSYYFTLVLTPFFLLSGIFFPLDELPDWAGILAWGTPLFHGVRLLRHLSFGDLGIIDVVHVSCILLFPLPLLAAAARKMRTRLLA